MAASKLLTTVTNPTAATRFYGYLASHGKALLAGASATYEGDLRARMSKRELASMDRDAAANKIVSRLDALVASVAGATAVSGVTAVESGDGSTHKTVLTFTNVVLSVVDTGGAGGGQANSKVYDFPTGMLQFMSAVADLVITEASATIIDTFTGNFAVGTVAAAADATLTATEANLIPSTAIPAAVASATTMKGKSTATEENKTFDGTSTAMDAYLNIVLADASISATSNVTVNGKLTLNWALLGNL